jgi:ureidoacrylate peracid hydrolase
MHPTNIPQDAAERITRRRGRLHAYDRLDPERTALIVVDMQVAFMGEGSTMEISCAREIVPAINRLATGMRNLGALVTWAKMTRSLANPFPTFYNYVLSPEMAEKTAADLTEAAPGHALWHELVLRPEDFVFNKNRFSAFARGSSGVEPVLRAKQIDSVVVCGTLTNVCCESTARDAMQLGFKTVLVSDACATRSDAEHVGALVTFLTSFGDVRTVKETLALFGGAARESDAAQ